MKKILLLSVTIFVLLSSVAYGAAKWGMYKGSQIVRLTVDGTPVNVSDVPAVSLNGRTMIPIYLLQQAGVKYSWDQKNQTVNIMSQKPVEKVKIVYALTNSQLEDLAKSVYLIHGSTDDPTKAKQGSGFIVNGMMITNHHVGGDSLYVQAKIDGNWQKVSSYEFANKELDLMGFKVNGGKSLPILTELPQPGDVVYAIGFPNGSLKVTEGVVRYISSSPEGYKQIVHTADLQDGYSGSALISGRGEVVGINKSSSYSGGVQYNWAIPTMYLTDLLK